MTRHPHYDVIIAFANGAEVEFFSEFDKKWKPAPNPGFVTDVKYRIKPTPKKCRVALMKNNYGPTFPYCYLEDHWHRVEESVNFIRWLTDVLEYTED